MNFKFDLDCKWSIYIPLTKDVNVKCDNSEEVRRVIGELSDMFGGATASRAIGGWRCEDGTVVVEDVTIVYACCTSAQAVAKADEVLGIARRICKDFNLEAVTVEYNGQVAFIGQD